MNEEIRELLKEKVALMMKNVTWTQIQEPNALKKLKCPVGYGTLWKLMKDDDYQMTPRVQCKMLKSFKVKHKRTFNLVELT